MTKVKHRMKDSERELLTRELSTVADVNAVSIVQRGTEKEVNVQYGTKPTEKERSDVESILIDRKLSE